MRLPIASPAIWLRFVISAITLVITLWLFPQFLSDYAQDYAAARGWWHGIDTNAHTADLLTECCADIAPQYSSIQTAHPPAATLLALPLAWLPWNTARLVWLVISWAAITITWQIMRVAPGVCAATACFWVIALGLGTHESLLFLLLALALVFTDRKAHLASILIGLCAAIKIYPALLIAGLWVSGRRKLALEAVAIAVIVFGICEIILGFGVTLGWLRFMPINTQFYVDSTGNGSLVRLVRAGIPNASPMIVALVAFVLLFLPLLPRLRHSEWLRPLLPVMLLVSPLSWRHYMGVVALNPLTLIDQLLLAFSGIISLLIGMQILPTDNMAVVIQIPLLIVLVLLWYRNARAARIRPLTAEPKQPI